MHRSGEHEHSVAICRVFGANRWWERVGACGVVSRMKVRRETVVKGYPGDNRAVVPCEDVCQSDGSTRKGKRNVRF